MLGLDALTPDDQSRVRSDLRAALGGGAMAALVMGAIVVLVGSVNSGQARLLLEASLPTTRFLASAVMTVSATTLALMLTLLSLSSGVDRELKRSHYERIRQIALVDVVAFVAATFLLVMLVVPIGESTEIPIKWYVGIYYGVSVWAAALGGALVAVMWLLYAAVRDFITVLVGDEDSPLVASDDAPDEGDSDGKDDSDEDATSQDDAGTRQTKAASARRSTSS